MKDCSRVFALLSEYLDRELPPADCEELQQHLNGCPECIEFVHSLQRSVQLCRQYGGSWTPPPIQPDTLAGLHDAYQKMLARRRK